MAIEHNLVRATVIPEIVRILCRYYGCNKKKSEGYYNSFFHPILISPRHNLKFCVIKITYVI